MRGLDDDAAPWAAGPESVGAVAAGGASRRLHAGSCHGAGFDCRKVGGCAVVGVAGEIDLATAPAFCAALLAGVHQSPRFVVDMSGVTFLDCSGLSALLTAVRCVRLSGGGMHLVVVAGVVARLVTLTGLDEVVPVDASLEEALASFAR
jgi:anti-anti-sigma factor